MLRDGFHHRVWSASSGPRKMDALSALQLIESAFRQSAFIVVREGVIVVWSRGAEVLTSRKATDVVGRTWGEIALSLPETGDVDEDLVTIGRPDGTSVDVRRWSRRIDDTGDSPAATIRIEIWKPIIAGDVGHLDGQQLLAYAKDIAFARAAERQRARELAAALQKLEETVQQLHDANATLEAQKHLLEDQVRGRTEELHDARNQLLALKAQDDGSSDFHGMVSAHPRMHTLFALVRQIGPSDVSVMIQGESGTGKELLARAIHTESRRAARAFVAVNCATLTPSLAESLLFGHKKGSFTSASADYDGVFAQAEGGTLFLDEVAELPLEVQSKLLRAIQERVYTPLGGSGTKNANVRIVVATHRDLRGEVQAGRFREDLMYRLRVAVLEIPPLAERSGDVIELIRAFLARHNGRGLRVIESFSPSAVRALLDYPWPGNIRELENALEYAFAVARGSRVETDDLPRDITKYRARSSSGDAQNDGGSERALHVDDEAARIRDAIRQSGGKLGDAAKLLGMSRATFHRKRTRLGIGLRG
jgi:DNA-binding NtrC family response regulator